MEQTLSPTVHLDKLLHSAPSQDPQGPRFLIPEAPAHRRTGRAVHGLRHVVQRIFGTSKGPKRDANDDRPLISSDYFMKHRQQQQQQQQDGRQSDHLPRYSSLGGRIGKAMASFSARIKSPSPRPTSHSLLGKPQALLGKPQALLGKPQASAPLQYSLSVDELQSGLVSAPPTPIAAKDVGMSLEDRIAANYKDCMKHRSTCLPVSLPELLVLLAKESTESVQLRAREQDARLYLVPLDARMAAPRFLSRSQPTRIGRNSGQVRVKSRVVSRNHCQVFKEDRADAPVSCYFITDVGSHSGTFVNGMRLSPTGSISSPCAIASGDIIQLGADFSESEGGGEGTDGEECVDLKAISFLALLGSPLKPAKGSNPEVRPLHEGIDAQLVSNDKVSRLYRKAMAGLGSEDGTCLYVEFGDLLHENSFGHALFARRDGPSYFIRFNNYRLTWEAMISEIKSGAPTLFCECAAGKEDQFVVCSSDADKRRKVARINLKDKKLAIVSPISEHRPLQKEPRTSESPSVSLTIARPASPYVTISQSSCTGPRTPVCSPRIEFMTTELRDALTISKPEVPFYLVSPGEVVAKDRNNALKERLLGQGQAKKDGALKWGRRVLAWHGNVAVCKDDGLVVLGMLLQQLMDR